MTLRPVPADENAEKQAAGLADDAKDDPASVLSSSSSDGSVAEMVSDSEGVPTPPVDGQRLLGEIERAIRRYVVVSQSQLVALALWVVHTHALEAATRTPYLHITSATPQCGKSRLFEVLDLLVREPWFADRVTVSSLARKIEAVQPTLLLDEADNAFKGNAEYTNELTALLNGGIRRGAKTTLSMRQGGDWLPKDFATFCPKALAGIGTLPATTADRCIRIELKRRLADELVEPFYYEDATEDLAPVRADAEVWAKQNLEELKVRRPEPLEGLKDRADEAWRVLFAIADQIGGEWPQRARDVALELSGTDTGVEEEDYGIRLLHDVRQVFADWASSGRISTKTLIEKLAKDLESPWARWWDHEYDKLEKGAPQRLAKQLRPFGIRSTTIRNNDAAGSTYKGYYAQDFADVWRRYQVLEPPEPKARSSASAASPAPQPVTDVTDVTPADKSLAPRKKRGLDKLRQEVQAAQTASEETGVKRKASARKSRKGRK
jgi:hypothetical protein